MKKILFIFSVMFALCASNYVSAQTLTPFIVDGTEVKVKVYFFNDTPFRQTLTYQIEDPLDPGYALVWGIVYNIGGYQYALDSKVLDLSTKYTYNIRVGRLIGDEVIEKLYQYKFHYGQTSIAVRQKEANFLPVLEP